MNGALRRKRKKLLGLAVTVVAALTTLVVPAVVAPQAAGAYACNASRDSFTGTVGRMEHFLGCNHIPYQVYTLGRPTVVTATPRSIMSGGPSCQWQTKHIVKICSQAFGKRYLICAQYWSGLYYPYHCGAIEAYNLTHAEGLWSVVKRAFTSHAAKACVRGTIGGGTTAVILKAAGSATGIGVVASLAGGCVGGMITFFWKI